jgi:hypothetical protein
MRKKITAEEEMTKYSQNYTFERTHNFSGLAEGAVALIIFAGAFLWLFL